MKHVVLLLALAFFVLGGFGGLAYPSTKSTEPPAQTAPDNTGRNVRDRNDAMRTPGDQSERAADRHVTQEIRRAVVADDSLSTMAKNVKIIVANGVVTLRGPVQNTQEKNTIETKAQKLAGSNKVDSQLEVKAR